jgi:hypothetical protein
MVEFSENGETGARMSWMNIFKGWNGLGWRYTWIIFIEELDDDKRRKERQEISRIYFPIGHLSFY